MAERRMFAKTIIDSDAFLEMPLSTQALYFHLSMRADDEGFLNNPRKILRMVGASDDDLRLLLAKNFIISFDNGVIVIKHWKIHNYIQNDRFKHTVYQEERKMLSLKENNAYTLDTECIQNGYTLETQVSIGKVSIDNNNIYRSVSKPKIDEIIDYLNQKCGTNYRKNTPKTVKLINTRLKEGFTLDDFKTVIDNKCKAWLSDTKMRDYLRPETLFGTKFEGYLNEKGATNGSDSESYTFENFI